MRKKKPKLPKLRIQVPSPGGPHADRKKERKKNLCRQKVR